MNFDFSDDQKLLQRTAREYLTEHAPLSVCRAVLESDASYSESLWRGIGELGWLGTSIPEEYGGSGFGYLEMSVLAEEVGRALAPVPFSSSLYLAAEALIRFGSDAQKKKYLPKLATGELIGAFAHAEKPGVTTAASIATTINGGKLSGTKMPVADGDIAHFAIVTAKGRNGIALAIADLAGAKRSKVESIDPSRSLASIQFDGAADILVPEEKGWAATEQLLDRAAILMAFEQLGGAERAFDLTREFCQGRYAFGRPISSFQALKHRMADMYVELQLTRSSNYYGAWALSNDSEELTAAACGARASACDTFELCSREMVQMHGGVGFTWEFDCHLFYRRAKWTGAILGTANQWRERLIQRLVA
jgi:acyl-CoA dehydrogenase